MKRLLKGVRPMDEINVEYSSICTHLGDRTFKIEQLQSEVEKYKARLREVDLEALACKQQMAAQPAEEAPSEVPAAPEAEAPQEAVNAT